LDPFLTTINCQKINMKRKNPFNENKKKYKQIKLIPEIQKEEPNKFINGSVNLINQPEEIFIKSKNNF
jgi:hypothetical protein